MLSFTGSDYTGRADSRVKAAFPVTIVSESQTDASGEDPLPVIPDSRASVTGKSRIAEPPALCGCLSTTDGRS